MTVEGLTATAENLTRHWGAKALPLQEIAKEVILKTEKAINPSINVSLASKRTQS